MKTRAGSGGEAAEPSYPWEETMGRLILLLVVMALSSHLEGQRRAEKTEEVVSMASPEFFGQSHEHSSPSNFPQLPLPSSPCGFDHQTPPTTKSNTTYSSTSKLSWISCLCLYRFLSPSTWIMCTHLSKHPSVSLLLLTDPAQQGSASSHRSTLLCRLFPLV